MTERFRFTALKSVMTFFATICLAALTESSGECDNAQKDDLLISVDPFNPNDNEEVEIRCRTCLTNTEIAAYQCRWNWSHVEISSATFNKESMLADIDGRQEVQIQPAGGHGTYFVVSSIVMPHMKYHHQGDYVCLLSCSGRKPTSASIYLELYSVHASRIARTHLLYGGIVIGSIILLAILVIVFHRIHSAYCRREKEYTHENAKYDINSEAPSPLPIFTLRNKDSNTMPLMTSYYNKQRVSKTSSNQFDP